MSKHTLTLGDMLPPKLQTRDPGPVDISCIGDPGRGALIELFAAYALSFAGLMLGWRSLLAEGRAGTFDFEAAEAFLSQTAEGLLPILDRTKRFTGEGGDAENESARAHEGRSRDADRH